MALVSSITKLRSIFDNDKGASYSNEYSVNFKFDGKNNSELLQLFRDAGFNVNSSDGAFKNMMLLCDEASLPGQYSATSEIDGLYTGRLIQYPQAKLYNDFTLSFIMTNKLQPAKFFDIWMYYMFPEYDLNGGEKIEYSDRSRRSSRTNVTTLRYYDQSICSAIEVTKFYKNSSAPNGGQSALYQMFKAYPYNVQTVPLAYGASTLNKLQVQFRYEKYVSTYY
jgi:hypothetical protein